MSDMREEIKEILDRLFVYKNENDEMKYQPEDILTINDVWLLLDYITNLQEENERLNNIIDELHNDLKTLWIVLWNMDTEMTGYQNEIFDKYYNEFHKE